MLLPGYISRDESTDTDYNVPIYLGAEILLITQWYYKKKKKKKKKRWFDVLNVFMYMM